MRTSHVVNYYVEKVEEEEGKDNKEMFNKTREYKTNLIGKVIDH